MPRPRFSSWLFLKTNETVNIRRGKKRREEFREHRGLAFIETWQADGILVSPDGRTWPARSGPKGRGALPDGTYTIGWPVGKDKIKRKFWKVWKDKRGNIWFAALRSNAIKRETGRDGFGIHPDGGSPGTKGCVGVRWPNTLPILKAIRRTPREKRILRVRYITEVDLQELFLRAQGR